MGKTMKFALFLGLIAGPVVYWHTFAHTVPADYRIYAEMFSVGAIVAALVIGFSFFRPKASPAKESPKGIVDGILSSQKLRINQNLEREEERYRNSKKVKQFKFSESQLQDIQVVKAETSSPKTGKISKRQKTVPSITLEISFKTIEEFEWILPGLEGTCNDFLKSVGRFSDILSIFITDEEEKEISVLLKSRKYNRLVETLLKHAYTHQKQASVSALLEGKSVHCLEYGCFLGREEGEDTRFVIDSDNLKLYKEIYCLLQDLFVEYMNGAKKIKCNSINDLLEKIPWEEIENIRFDKDLEELGRDTLNLLVEDFLNSLKPVKRKEITEYRFFRMVLRDSKAQEPIEVGNTLKKILDVIQETHKKIKEHISVKTPDEITQMVKATQISSNIKKELKDIFYRDEKDILENRLIEKIFGVSRFLGWFPVDLERLSEEEKILLDYFDKLLYSRKSRLSIIQEEGKSKEGVLFAERMEKVMQKLKEAEAILESLKKKHPAGLIGRSIEVIPPRQCEDYFPYKGVLEDIVMEEIEGGHIIKLEVLEHNRLRSHVIFTGNNVIFPN